jgi:branched-subunit amino acid ABC-type transport system permease component
MAVILDFYEGWRNPVNAILQISENQNVNQLIEQSFNALTLGGIYALIAVGYTMVYGIIKLINFAHGEIYMFGAFAGVLLIGQGVSFWLALPLAMLFCAVLGFLIDKFAYKPLRKSPRLSVLITAIGISIILQNLAMLIFGAEPRAFPNLSSSYIVWVETRYEIFFLKGDSEYSDPLKNGIFPQLTAEDLKLFQEKVGTPPRKVTKEQRWFSFEVEGKKYFIQKKGKKLLFYTDYGALSEKVFSTFQERYFQTLENYRRKEYANCSFLRRYINQRTYLQELEEKYKKAQTDLEKEKILRELEEQKQKILQAEAEMPEITHLEKITVKDIPIEQGQNLPKNLGAVLINFRLGTNEVHAQEIFSSAKTEIFKALETEYQGEKGLEILDEKLKFTHWLNRTILPGLSYKSVMILIVTFLLMFLLELIVHQTTIGKAMRACALDKTTASLMGINVDRVISFTFMIGSALAAVAGILYALYLGSGVSYRMGYYAGVFAFAAAVLGGIGNIRGALLGGFILGFVQVLTDAYLTRWLGISSDYKFAFAFGTLILCILIRPTGILGTVSAERA